ncbi:phytoene desaturase family protein [Bounagaea algeriensis]
MRTVAGPTDRVVIIGAGLSGLAAALHLAGAGREVTVVERASGPGGRAGRQESGDYRIDTGPTVVTMPELFDEALAAVGDSLRERVELLPLHPAYRARFADGSALDVHSDAEAMEAEVRRFAGPREARGYRRLRRWLTAMYRAEWGRFIDANFDSPADLLRPELARVAWLGGFGRLERAVRRFLSDPRVVRVFTFQSLYAGLDPRQALALYSAIPYMDTVGGVWFPRGGTHALPRALAEAAAQAGVRFRFGEQVTGVQRRAGRAAALHTTSGRIPADAVVSTADLPETWQLLGRAPRREPTWAHSAVVWHVGSSTPLTDAHHTISFGAAWSDTFAELSRGRLMSDPSLLVTRPTATDAALAPAGRELQYVLAPCPNLRTGAIDWDRVGPAYRDELAGTLRRRGFLADGDEPLSLSLVTPADWAARGYAAGTPFSAAHTFAQTGPFRQRNLVHGWENVVLAGSGTTPGVGVPPVLLSGKHAAQRITGQRITGQRATGR